MTLHTKLTPLHILNALDTVGGLRVAAAKLLGISPATLRRRMQDFGLEDYTWDLSSRQRVLHTYELKTLEGVKRDEFPALARFLRDVDWGFDSINEPRRLSLDEVKEMVADWKDLPVQEYANPTFPSAVASGGRSGRHGRTRKRRRANTGSRSAG